MVNRINIFQPDAPMSYDDRIKILKERKLEETRVKSTMKVYQDGDDYGSIPAPETYQFHCIPNHENGSWYGYDGWSKNFYKLMTEHPVYIDPVDAFTCRWMFSMIWFDEKSPDKGLNWNPNFPSNILIRITLSYPSPLELCAVINVIFAFGYFSLLIAPPGNSLNRFVRYSLYIS